MSTAEEKKYPMDQTLEAHIAQIIDQEIFYPRNLTNDDQLISSIDSNGYIPLSFITENRLIKTLTRDRACIVRGIQLSKSIQMSEDGRRIRIDLQPKRNTLILRNQPDNATQKDIEHIFLNDPNCAKFRELRPDISNTWFVTFDTEEECMNTVRYLQEKKHLSVGMKNAVNPLAELSEKQTLNDAHQPQTPPRGAPRGAGTASTGVDILATATIPTGPPPSQPEYYTNAVARGYEEPDIMARYRNPYGPMTYYGNPPMMPDISPPSPPMQLPQSPPQQTSYQQRVDLAPREPLHGDYNAPFLSYQRNAMVDIYQNMLAEDKIFIPEEMDRNVPCTITDRLESTMVQQPTETQRRRGERNRSNRQSPRGGRGNRGGDRYDDYGPQGGPSPFFDEEYQRPPHDYDEEPLYPYENDDDEFDEPYEERPERRNRRRGNRRNKGQGGRGGKGRGGGGGGGRGGRSNRRSQSGGNGRSRREYRPKGEAAAESSNKPSVNGTSSPQRGQSSSNRRGRKPKLVYRPKES